MIVGATIWMHGVPELVDWVVAGFEIRAFDSAWFVVQKSCVRMALTIANGDDGGGQCDP